MFKTKKGPIIVFLLLLFSVLLYFRFSQNSQNNNTGLVENEESMPFITAADNKIFVDVADTTEKKSKGLSNRTSLGQNRGMIFIWKQETSPGFWMKDMNFPIDIIWIRDNKIIGIEENAQPQPGAPDSELKVFRAPGLTDAVLEVNAGYAKAHNLMVGTEIEYTGL